MPIYAYKCDSCQHAKDVLQKISDPLLTVCPACGAATFKKQLTAAGFQLKGSGWYVTDFRGGDAAGAAKSSDADGSKTAGTAGAVSDGKAAASGTGTTAAGAATSGAPAPASNASSASTSASSSAPASSAAASTPSSGA